MPASSNIRLSFYLTGIPASSTDVSSVIARCDAMRSISDRRHLRNRIKLTIRIVSQTRLVIKMIGFHRCTIRVAYDRVFPFLFFPFLLSHIKYYESPVCTRRSVQSRVRTHKARIHGKDTAITRNETSRSTNNIMTNESERSQASFLFPPDINRRCHYQSTCLTKGSKLY